MTVVVVGRFTATDCGPGETLAPWEAFRFESRRAALAWPLLPWYPLPLILQVQVPA